MTSDHIDHCFMRSHKGTQPGPWQEHSQNRILSGETTPWSNPPRVDRTLANVDSLKNLLSMLPIASSWPPSSNLKAHKKHTPVSFTVTFHPGLEVAGRAGASRFDKWWSADKQSNSAAHSFQWGSCSRTSSWEHPGQRAREDEWIQRGCEDTCKIYSISSLRVIGQLENPKWWKVMLFNWSFWKNKSSVFPSRGLCTCIRLIKVSPVSTVPV